MGGQNGILDVPFIRTLNLFFYLNRSLLCLWQTSFNRCYVVYTFTRLWSQISVCDATSLTSRMLDVHLCSGDIPQLFTANNGTWAAYLA